MCGHPIVTLIGLAGPAVYETEPCSVYANTSQASVVPVTLIWYVKALHVQHSAGNATDLPSLQPQAIIHSFNEINSLETDVLRILLLCLAPGTFFDVDVFRIIRWRYNRATDTGLQIFIEDP